MALTEAGLSVAVLARTEEDVQAVAAEIRHRGGTALPIAADVTAARDVERAFQMVLNEFSVLDILVNNAGTGIRKPFMEMTSSEWDCLIDLNFKSIQKVLLY